MFPGDETPRSESTISVPQEEVLDEAGGGEPSLHAQPPLVFDDGMPLQNIDGNFVDNESRPHIPFEESQNQLIRQLPWFAAWSVGHWEQQ